MRATDYVLGIGTSARMVPLAERQSSWQRDYVGGGGAVITNAAWTESSMMMLLTASHPSPNNKQRSYCDQYSLELRAVE